MRSKNTIKVVNIITLLVGIAIILLLPAKKEIWYDESISIMCSKGITHNSDALFEGKSVIQSTELAAQNTAANVFTATVNDNGNSYLYNMGLHWFTYMFGNSVGSYMLFSKLIAILALIAFAALSRSLLGESWLVSLAVLLLVTDIDFISMSHEIRAYMMGLLFATLAGIYLFRYMDKKESAGNLFMIALFAAALVLTHFLSIYVVGTIVICLFVLYRAKLFTVANIAAIVAPMLLVGVFFLYAKDGLLVMSEQNAKIHDKSTTATGAFDSIKVIIGSLRFLSVNFKAVFPAFVNKTPVIIASAAGVLSLYIAAVRVSANKITKRNLHILFAAGASSSLFLALVCFKSGHYTALYYRYHTFALPFCTLFVVYAISVLQASTKINKLIQTGVVFVFSIPAVLLFVIGVAKTKTEQKFNHAAVAATIVRTQSTSVELPSWQDIYLVQSFLPDNYKIDYVRNSSTPYFTLRFAGGEEKIPVIAKNN